MTMNAASVRQSFKKRFLPDSLQQYTECVYSFGPTCYEEVDEGWRLKINESTGAYYENKLWNYINASRSLDRARAFCQENNIEKAYGSYEELYQDPEITAVYITTINREHFHEMKQALNYGKHVLCEKPFTLSKPQAIEIFQLAKEKGLFVMEMQKSLFLPVTDLIKTYIDSGMLGKLHQVNMSASFQSPKASWMHEKDQGGVVYGSAS